MKFKVEPSERGQIKAETKFAWLPVLVDKDTYKVWLESYLVIYEADYMIKNRGFYSYVELGWVEKEKKSF